MLIERRRAALMLALAPFAAPSVLAQATKYPNRPIRVVLPSSAGSGTDLLARKIAMPMQEILGQALVIENLPGAGGVLGAEALIKADKDGHAIGMVSNSLLIAPFIYKKLRFNLTKDIVPIAMVGSGPLLLVARSEFQPSTIQELRAASLKAPGKITYASTGGGSILRLVAEHMQHMGGFKLMHVPYKGINQVFPDVMGGFVDLAFLPYPSVAGFVKQGKMKVLGTSGTSRLGFLPETAAIRETIPGFEFSAWNAVAAPAGVDPAIISKLNAAFTTVVTSKEISAFMLADGTEPVTMTPAQMRKFFAAESDKFASIVKTAGITED